MGGVARRATMIKNARADSANVLVLDAGNSLFGQVSNSNEPATRTEGQSSVDALNRLGYDAVALGDQDLLLGHDVLQQRLAEAQSFTFVSANLQDEATGELFAQPYLLKDVGGHKVAIIGITGQVPPEATGFALTPPLDAARQYVQEVQSKADIIILLSNAGAKVNQSIAEQVPGIDLIISGGQDPLNQPVKAGPDGTLIAQAEMSTIGHAGRIIGDLKADFDITGHLTGHTWQATAMDHSIADDLDMAPWVQSMTQPQ